MSDVLNPPHSAEGNTGLPTQPSGKVIAVTSGKGGVGKTFVSADRKSVV